jgi:hypothetical protein
MTKKSKQKLTPVHIKALQMAVHEAEAWRGTLIGNPDPTPLQQFDAYIAIAKQALRIVVKNYKVKRKPL